MYWRRTDKEFPVTNYEKKLKRAIRLIGHEPHEAWSDMLEFGGDYDKGTAHIFSSRMIHYTDAPINGATHTHMGPIQSDVLLGSITNRLYTDRSITDYRDRVHSAGVRYETFGPIIHRVHTFDDICVTFFTESAKEKKYADLYNDDIHVRHGSGYKHKNYNVDELIDDTLVALKEQLKYVKSLAK